MDRTAASPLPPPPLPARAAASDHAGPPTAVALAAQEAAEKALFAKRTRDLAHVSASAGPIQQLSGLLLTNPGEYRRVMSRIGEKLKVMALQAVDPEEYRRLKKLSDAFFEAAEKGRLPDLGKDANPPAHRAVQAYRKPRDPPAVELLDPLRDKMAELIADEIAAIGAPEAADGFVPNAAS